MSGHRLTKDGIRYFQTPRDALVEFCFKGVGSIIGLVPWSQYDCLPRLALDGTAMIECHFDYITSIEKLGAYEKHDSSCPHFVIAV